MNNIAIVGLMLSSIMTFGARAAEFRGQPYVDDAATFSGGTALFSNQFDNGFVPSGSKSSYLNTEGLSEFQNIGENASSSEILATGSCGDNVTYTIYSDMTMVISGTGEMWNYVDDYFWYKKPERYGGYYSEVKNVIIEEGVTSIGRYAFYDFGSLSSLTIPNTVTSIGDLAISYCDELTSITIPNSVTRIGCGAFYGSSLSSLYIPASVSIIESDGPSADLGSSYYDGVFCDCSALTTITVDANNPYYDSRDGCNAIIKTSSNSLIAGCSGTIIPNSVTTIADNAFFRCTGLTTINIPNSVTSIAERAFYDCTSLTSIEIPNSVTTIADYAFSGCRGLTFITVEHETPISLSSHIFEDVVKNSCTLYVPTGSKSAYESASVWGEFQNIVESASAPVVLATGLCGDDVYYTIYSDKSMVISGCGAMTDFIINYDDDEIIRENNEYWTQVKTVTIKEDVTSIGNYAFSNCLELTTVSIPNSVTFIGVSSFMGCSNLTTVTIPSSVEVIGDCAFSYSGLTHFTIEDGFEELLFGSSSGSGIEFFEECPLEYVYMGRNIRTNNPEGSIDQLIRWGSVTYPPFSGQSSLTTLVIGDNVTTLEDYSFSGAPLQSLVIGKNVQTLGMYALSSANIGETISIPSNVTRVGDCCFSPYISQLVIEKGDNDLELFGGVYSMDLSFCGIGDDDETIVESVYVGRNLTYSTYAHNRFVSAYIDAELTAIPQEVEYGDEGNDVVVLSYKASPIEATNIYFENDGSLGRYYFHDCSSIEHIYNMNPSKIGDFAFTNCSGLKTVSFDVNEPTSIRPGVFAECQGLTSLVLPDEITSIGSSAFYNCGLRELHVGPTPAQIDESTFFYGSYGEDEEGEQSVIRTLYVPIGCRSVYQNAEYWDCFDNIVEDAGNLEVLATGSCGDNVTYTIYSDMTMVISGTGTIEDNGEGEPLFPYYLSIKKVIIEEGVTKIKDQAFSYCSSLTSVSIPESVSEIWDNAFSDCTSLASITIPTTVAWICGNAFQNTAWYNSQADGLIYINNVAYKYKGTMPGDTDVVINDGTVCISGRAFHGCTGLTSVTIPSSVTSIGSSAFSGCTGLVSVNIPNSLTTISDEAFYHCTALTTVTIPNSVTEIQGGAFEGCTGLTSISIGEGVSRISIAAFSGCSGLTSIYLSGATPANLGNTFGEGISSVFDGVDKTNCTLFVPVGSKTAYESASGWSAFENIVENVPDTDISAYDNIVYIEGTEAIVGQRVRLSLKMNNIIAPTGFQCDVYLPDGVTAAQDEDGFYLMDISTERTTARKTDYSASVMQPDGGLRFMCSSTKSYTFSGNEGEVAYLMVDIDSNIEEGTYPLILKNIEISDANSNAYRVSYVKTTLTVSTYTLGDANNDGSIGVSDFTAIANYIMGTPPASFVEKAADVNVDGVISVSDLTGEANIILYGTVTPNASHAKARDEATAKYASIGAKDVTAATDKEFTVAVSINGNYAYSGYQFDVALPEGMTVKDVYGQRKATDVFKSGMIDDNTLRVLCASTMGETTESTVVYLTLEAESAGTYSMDIDNAIISANSSTYTMSNSSFLIAIDKDATGISDLGDEASRNDVVYDLTGRKLMSNGSKSSLQKGIYIINGHKITK